LRKSIPFSFVQYTLMIQNIRNTILILSCTPFCPQNSLNVLGHGLYKVSKAFHSDAGPFRLQCFPQLSSWMDVLWVVDHSWYTQETERESCWVWGFWIRKGEAHALGAHMQ
jgi:hypothetical protein